MIFPPTASSLRRRAAILRESAARSQARAAHARLTLTDFWQEIADEAERCAARALERAEALDTRADEITARRAPWPFCLLFTTTGAA